MFPKVPWGALLLLSLKGLVNKLGTFAVGLHDEGRASSLIFTRQSVAILPLTLSISSTVKMGDGFRPPVVWKAGEPFDFTLVFELSIFSILLAVIFILVAVERIITLLAKVPLAGGRYFQCSKFVGFVNSYSVLILR